MEVVNHTPFPSIGWISYDPKDQAYVTALCRVKLLFDTKDEEGLWSLKFAPEQENLFTSDVFYEGKKLEVRYESDFVPYKKQADLVVNISKEKREYISCGIEVKRYENSEAGESLLKHMSLNHLGFVHRAEASRLQWTGTADKAWIENRAPKFPLDFNERHYNAAHENLQLKNKYFEAGDVCVLHKLLPGEHQQIVIIPGIYLKATIQSGTNKKSVLLEADTVLFDIEKFDMEENCIYVSYRQRIAMDGKIEKVIFDVKLDQEHIEQRSA